MAEFDADLTGDNTEWNIELDLDLLAQKLATHPAFVKALAMHVRNAQTKDVRRMGNLYGTTAQAKPAPPTTKRRLN